MSAIIEVRGIEILDSRGNPTVEAEVILETGVKGRAAVLRLLKNAMVVIGIWAREFLVL